MEDATNLISENLFAEYIYIVAKGSSSETFFDDFNTDTTGNYIVVDKSWDDTGSGSFIYDAASEIAQAVSGNDNGGVMFSHNLSPSESGTFKVDFLPIIKYPFGGRLIVRLLQDDNNYYELENSDGYGPLEEVRKVINGVTVDWAPFKKEFLQEINYFLAISFSPSLTMINAFGELLLMNENTESIIVNRFEIMVVQQDAFFDNIEYY